MELDIRVSGTWHKATSVHARVSGVWQPVKQVYARTSGVWQLVYQNSILYAFIPSVPGTSLSGTITIPANMSQIEGWIQGGGANTIGSGGGGGAFTMQRSAIVSADVGKNISYSAGAAGGVNNSGQPSQLYAVLLNSPFNIHVNGGSGGTGGTVDFAGNIVSETGGNNSGGSGGVSGYSKYGVVDPNGDSFSYGSGGPALTPGGAGFVVVKFTA